MMMMLTCNVWKMQCSGDMGILSSRGIASNSSWNKTEIIGTPCVLWNNRYHDWYHHGNQRLRKRTCWTPNEASRRPKFCGWILTLWAGNGYMPIALWESGYFFPNLFHGIKFVYDTTTTFAWWIKIQVFVVSSSQFRLGSKCVFQMGLSPSSPKYSRAKASPNLSLLLRHLQFYCFPSYFVLPFYPFHQPQPFLVHY